MIKEKDLHEKDELEEKKHGEWFNLCVRFFVALILVFFAIFQNHHF